MRETERASVGVNPRIPSVARIYDYFLEGKDNFAADRAAGDQIIAMVPGIRQVARENRAFIGRAVRALSALGIHQFLDIGTGLPTRENVHEIALAARSDATVVYVDNDPIVLAHARALLADNVATVVLEGDLRAPEAIVDGAAAHLDFGEPVAVLLAAILHFVSDDEETYRIVETLLDRLAPGGALVVSHAGPAGLSPQAIAETSAVYAKTATGSITMRGLSQVGRYFQGTALLEPGVVPVHIWRPEPNQIELDIDHDLPGGLCGVGIVR